MDVNITLSVEEAKRQAVLGNDASAGLIVPALRSLFDEVRRLERILESKK